MTKEEFIGKVKELLANNAIYPEIKSDLETVIQQAIAEHDKAILDDVEFGYDLEMIKGKLTNKSYQPKEGGSL